LNLQTYKNYMNPGMFCFECHLGLTLNGLLTRYLTGLKLDP